MPEMSTITVADATPANHDFLADAVSNGLGTWLEKSETSRSGYWDLKMSQRNASNGSEVYKPRLTLAIPTVVTETINGVDRVKVERVLRYEITEIAHKDSTDTERLDGITILFNLLQHADVQALFVDLENVRG